jgi:hypothetical protein
MRNHIMRRSGLAILALMTLLVLSNMTGQAAGYSPGCGQIPIVGGIPPWGFHTGPPVGETGSFARGHGQINLERATLFASYNCVRSDSVQFFFPAACRDHDHLYHGPQVNNQVPPP